MKPKFACLIVVVIGLLTAHGLLAQQPPAAASHEGLPDISGIWNRLDTFGARSYDEVTANFPQAELLPEAAAKLPPKQFEGFGAPPPGPPPVYDIRAQNNPTPRCAVGGGIGTGNTSPNINSAGMSIVATRDLVLMLRDGAQGGRYMFADGRPFPAKFRGSLYHRPLGERCVRGHDTRLRARDDGVRARPNRGYDRARRDIQGVGGRTTPDHYV